MDDGRCHICRRWPAREDSAYGVTACVSCEETAAVKRAKRCGYCHREGWRRWLCLDAQCMRNSDRACRTCRHAFSKRTIWPIHGALQCERSPFPFIVRPDDVCPHHCDALETPGQEG